MTIEELKEAHEKGRTIQFRLDGRTWVDWLRPSFDSDPDDYRIKETDKMEEAEGLRIGGNCKHLYHVNTGGCYDAKCDLTYCDCVNCKDKWELRR